MKFPTLIVFDFHGTLSLKSGSSKMGGLLGDFETSLDKNNVKYAGINNLKNALRKYKLATDKLPIDWYVLMNRAQIDQEILIPNLSDLIRFVEYVKRVKPNTVFAIASMIESENFMSAMMRYVFEIRGKLHINPFNSNTIIGRTSLTKYGNLSKTHKGKQQHIHVIKKNLGLENLPNNEIILIDDKEQNINDITTPVYDKVNNWVTTGYNSICGLVIDNSYEDDEFFTIGKWNKNLCGFSKVPDK